MTRLAWATVTAEAAVLLSIAVWSMVGWKAPLRARHDRVKELLGALATDTSWRAGWPELEDIEQFGTRRLLTAYGRAEDAERHIGRVRGFTSYHAAITELEAALQAAAHDARVLGNPGPRALLDHLETRSTAGRRHLPGLPAPHEIPAWRHTMR
ncbi:hypothetical protein OIU91_41260 (plasmid) [Streptomyces sp. NBC_01456]|uniref:hypothetical protein n=1 Tax=unclassified Streptomyces TaxID=2593676 RepID=UPI002E30AD6F|nr:MULTISPECIES: hypothetical protein [unclassified Streptomyces]